MKNTFYLLVLILFFTSCEKDDFCTQETPKTPKLILRFYDNANKESYKDVKYLSVWAVNKDTLTDYRNVTKDSIAIPLNTLSNETVYFLKMNPLEGNIANNLINKLTITYTTEDIFISRACGYKTIFNDVEITSDNGWFLEYTPTSLTTINNETEAHVKVYF